MSSKQENTLEAKTLFQEIANGDKDAENFINLWSSYCHLFDDLIDGDVAPEAGQFVSCDRLLLRLTTCKFYDTYRTSLMPMQILIGESYTASERYKTYDKSVNISLFNYSKYLSHTGNDMLRLVALITGGEAHLDYISEKLRLLTIKEHPEG